MHYFAALRALEARGLASIDWLSARADMIGLDWLPDGGDHQAAARGHLDAVVEAQRVTLAAMVDFANVESALTQAIVQAAVVCWAPRLDVGLRQLASQVASVLPMLQEALAFAGTLDAILGERNGLLGGVAQRIRCALAARSESTPSECMSSTPSFCADPPTMCRESDGPTVTAGRF